MQHIIGKLLTKATTFFKISFQLEVCRQSYGPPKLKESQHWKFRDSHLGIPGQNIIWVLVPWPGTKYTIRGKVVASPKFGPWWVLWVRVAHDSSEHQTCSNYALTNLLFSLCMSVWVNKLLVNLLSPIPKLQHAPLPPKCCKPRSMPQLLTLLLFSFQIHIWIYQGVWERINYTNILINIFTNLPKWFI